MPKVPLPHSEQAAHETIALPIYPELTEPQLDHVATTVMELVGQRAPAAATS